MEPEVTDVPADSSNANDAPIVTGNEPAPEPGPDRPWQNLKGEFDRKLGKLERQLDAVMQHLTVTQPAPQQAPADTVSDDDLWALAQQGDRGAFDLYMERRAARTVDTKVNAQRGEALVDGQLNALVAKFPVLRDATHPLTQTVQHAYNLLLQNGNPPGKATLLQAGLLAIADRPDLVTAVYSQTARAADTARRSAVTTARAGQTTVTHRDAPAPNAPQRPLSAGEATIARRMGVKDPAKAKERFLKRQEMGQSALGSVASFVDTEGF